MEILSEHKKPIFYSYSAYLAAKRRGRRGSSDYVKWRNKVLNVYDYKCAKCGKTENLQVHHKKQYIDNIFLRTQTQNGVVLCKECHSSIHPWMIQDKKPKCILRKAKLSEATAQAR